MRAVTGEDIGAGIDRRVREGRNELGRLVQLGAGLGVEKTAVREVVAVEAHDHPVRLAAGFADPARRLSSTSSTLPRLSAEN